MLEEYIKKGKTSVFLGSSGVGKSSLLNALYGNEYMKVNSIRKSDSRGRHTTTHRELLMLQSGAMIIDTPGMRALGMWDISEGIGETFFDIKALISKCRFTDCRHESEPGCAIKDAIMRGEITKERFNNYLSLKNEAQYSDDKESFLKKKQEKFKDPAKKNRKIKEKRRIEKDEW